MTETTHPRPPVRTRVAPSPTGDPHVGTAYIALINYCFAKKAWRVSFCCGSRIPIRSVRPLHRKCNIGLLKWLGLSWDEGPDVGGPHGPYRQSERSAIYTEHCDQLIADGHAFKCYCTPEKLASMRRGKSRQSCRPNMMPDTVSFNDAWQ